MSDGTTRRHRHHESNIEQTQRLLGKLDQLMLEQDAILARIRLLVVESARKEGNLYGNK